MGADFRGKSEKDAGMSVSRGIYIDGGVPISVEVYERRGRGVKISVSAREGDIKREYIAYNQPVFNGAGVNKSLAVLDREAELPDSGKGIEAYFWLSAALVDQERGFRFSDCAELLEYDGPTADEIDRWDRI